MTQMDSMLPTWVLYLQAFSTPAIDSVSPHSSDEHLSPAGPEKQKKGDYPDKKQQGQQREVFGMHP